MNPWIQPCLTPDILGLRSYTSQEILCSRLAGLGFFIVHNGRALMFAPEGFHVVSQGLSSVPQDFPFFPLPPEQMFKSIPQYVKPRPFVHLCVHSVVNAY